jgi:hypothetical protein
MAIGSDATQAGYPLVPDTGEEGKVKWGAREINRTRDLIALVKKLIPTSRPAWRTATGISSGTVNPSGGADGDIYFKII